MLKNPYHCCAFAITTSATPMSCNVLSSLLLTTRCQVNSDTKAIMHMQTTADPFFVGMAKTV